MQLGRGFVFGGIAERAQLKFPEAKFSEPVSGSFLRGAEWSEKSGLRARAFGSPALAAGIQVRWGGALNWLVVGDGRAGRSPWVEGNTRIFYEAGMYLHFSTLNSRERQGLAFQFFRLPFERPNKTNSTHCHCATPCPIRPGKLALR